MWRLTKAIIVSWLVGVIYGVGMVITARRPRAARHECQYSGTPANEWRRACF